MEFQSCEPRTQNIEKLEIGWNEGILIWLAFNSPIEYKFDQTKSIACGIHKFEY